MDVSKSVLRFHQDCVAARNHVLPAISVGAQLSPIKHRYHVRLACDPPIRSALLARRCRAHLNAAAAHWHLWRLNWDMVDRARHPFPAEPVRTLDAIRLASALAVHSIVPNVELLSLDVAFGAPRSSSGFPLEGLMIKAAPKAVVAID